MEWMNTRFVDSITVMKNIFILDWKWKITQKYEVATKWNDLARKTVYNNNNKSIRRRKRKRKRRYNRISDRNRMFSNCMWSILTNIEKASLQNHAIDDKFDASKHIND